MRQAATDEELMLAYMNGDIRAFEELYRRHSPKVYGFLKARLRETALVDDVFQSTFLKLHLARDRYDPSLPFTPWLFTVCRSVMVDALRKRNRIEEDLDQATVDAARAPELATSTALSLPGVEDLSSIQRDALTLRYREEMSFQRIAQRLETTPSNARQIVSRAVRALRRLSQGSSNK